MPLFITQTLTTPITWARIQVWDNRVATKEKPRFVAKASYSLDPQFQAFQDEKQLTTVYFPLTSRERFVAAAQGKDIFDMRLYSEFIDNAQSSFGGNLEFEPCYGHAMTKSTLHAGQFAAFAKKMDRDPSLYVAFGEGAEMFRLFEGNSDNPASPRWHAYYDPNKLYAGGVQ